MEEPLKTFKLGITWSQFGNTERSNVDRLLDSRADFTPQQRIVIEDLWANHPNRQQGKFNFAIYQSNYKICVYLFLPKNGSFYRVDFLYLRSLNLINISIYVIHFSFFFLFL